MSHAEKGNKIKVHYTGRLDDGTVFDTSEEREPLEFTLGEGRLIKGFENAVTGMKVGESKTVTIVAEDAYGQRRPELERRVERQQFPNNIDPEVGLFLNIRQPDGGVLEAVITEVSDSSVVIDANHPLSGKDLTFEIEVVDIAT